MIISKILRKLKGLYSHHKARAKEALVMVLYKHKRKASLEQYVLIAMQERLRAIAAGEDISPAFDLKNIAIPKTLPVWKVSKSRQFIQEKCVLGEAEFTGCFMGCHSFRLTRNMVINPGPVKLCVEIRREFIGEIKHMSIVALGVKS